MTRIKPSVRADGPTVVDAKAYDAALNAPRRADFVREALNVAEKLMASGRDLSRTTSSG